MEDKQVVIALQGMLGNALRGKGAMGGQSEPLLQRRQRQPLPLVGLLDPAQDRLVTGQSAAHIQGFHHQSGGGITVAAIAQLLPQLPPALIGEQLPLVAAVQQGARLAAQGID